MGRTIMSNTDMCFQSNEHNAANLSAAQSPQSMHRQRGMFSNNPQSDFMSGFFLKS